MRSCAFAFVLVCAASSSRAFAQSASVSGVVRDDSGGVLAGVTVEVMARSRVAMSTTTDADGRYSLHAVAPGTYDVAFTIAGFGATRRHVDLRRARHAIVDAVLHLTASTDVTVAAKRTLRNLSDVQNPAENLVGIAVSASQGALTAAQLETRPLIRTGEVLEAVPGVIAAQHAGSGKASQYFLRGFNLDHGTDFATTVGGVPVNLPSHAHGQGYSDLNFVIPELVGRVTFSKGPYYADQGDFATAGASAIDYVNALDRPIATIEAGGRGFGRVLFAASPRVAAGRLLGAVEFGHDDGPWTRPDDFRKVNGVVRYSRGDATDGFSATAAAYRSRWNSSDQVPDRALATGALNRFGTIDPSDGGETYRYALSGAWQRASRSGDASTRVTAYGFGYGLDLFSNFTYFLKDPVRGDQIEQTDHRFTTGMTAMHRRATRWGARPVESIAGVQVRNDDIADVSLSHTRARVRLETIDAAAVVQTAAGAYGQTEIAWMPWLRTTAGLRADAVRFRVDARDPANSGRSTAGMVSPKGGIALGPWQQTELYVNAGTGFHSNDARGTTIRRDPDGNPVDRVTPLVRARGAEAGVRSTILPHLQATAAWWVLHLDSELVFSGDEGTTASAPPSARRGVELTGYYHPAQWLAVDGEWSSARARFTAGSPVERFVPEAAGVVFSAGAAVSGAHGASVTVRWRYFGSRPLVNDNSIRSQPTSLVTVGGGYRLSRGLRLAADVFNAFDTAASDVDYFYTSRLPGEPAEGIADLHTHPVAPRTARVRLILDLSR